MNQLGVEAERIACIFLQKQGLTLVCQNYQSRYGEIDIVMRDGKTLVFTEVRQRRNAQFGGAAYSITPSKIQKLTRTAMAFMQQFGESSARFDVILMRDTSEGGLEWIKNAFDASL